jgi:Co/Zn/Cd efflux system component
MHSELSSLKSNPTSPPVQLSSLDEIVLFIASKFLLCKSLTPTLREHKKAALDISLYTNVIILITKIFAYAISGSLSVLAALMDSALDILSQVILYWAENKR